MLTPAFHFKILDDALITFNEQVFQNIRSDFLLSFHINFTPNVALYNMNYFVYLDWLWKIANQSAAGSKRQQSEKN